ncbi:MAG: hypothetical protein ACFFFB_13985 [Candidatus Heimdallarchaeota archaeon]
MNGRFIKLLEIIIMIRAKYQTGNKRDQSLYYYHHNLRDCIDRNRFIKETRKKLKRRKLTDVLGCD